MNDLDVSLDEFPALFDVPEISDASYMFLQAGEQAEFESMLSEGDKKTL